MTRAVLSVVLERLEVGRDVPPPTVLSLIAEAYESEERRKTLRKQLAKDDKLFTRSEVVVVPMDVYFDT